MPSFISTLPLFILILSKCYFTLPVINKHLSNSTVSSLHDRLTTEQTSNFQLVHNDQTSISSEISTKRSIEKHIGFNSTVPVDERSVENILYGFDELAMFESIASTTEQILTNKHHRKDLSSDTAETMVFTTIELSTEIPKVKQRSFDVNLENNTQEIQAELTTNDIFLFSPTSSVDVPKLYTSKSSNSISTEKSVVHLHDQNKDEATTKSLTTEETTTTESDVATTKNFEYESMDFEEVINSTGVLDMISNDMMIREETNDVVVTDLPTEFSTSRKKTIKEEISLNQGSTLILFLLAALLFCGFVSASVLACVKNRHTLKRKSRITEMEAHLDEHYQHYPHPFMFPQHH